MTEIGIGGRGGCEAWSCIKLPVLAYELEGGGSEVCNIMEDVERCVRGCTVQKSPHCWRRSGSNACLYAPMYNPSRLDQRY